MGLDICVARDEAQAEKTQPALSLSLREHKAIFHTPENRFADLKFLSRIGHSKDSQFSGEDLAGLANDIRVALPKMANPAVAESLRQIGILCDEAKSKDLGLFCISD